MARGTHMLDTHPSTAAAASRAMQWHGMGYPRARTCTLAELLRQQQFQELRSGKTCDSQHSSTAGQVALAAVLEHGTEQPQ
jgi:hypothetical protein